jgi:type 1 fimbriae regulatory protein FimB
LRISEAIQMWRNQLDLKRSRLWVARLKGSLNVEHSIAGDERRAIKRYLASREDNLPWLLVSERGARLTRQAVNTSRAWRREGEAQQGLAPHAPPFLRLSPCRPGH